MKHLKIELEFIHSILDHGATYEDKLKIVELYKKYIDGTLVHFSVTNSSCASCNDSINKLWQKVKEYVLGNSGLFIN